MSTRAALNSQTLEEFVQRAARASPPSTSTAKTPEDTILEKEEEVENETVTGEEIQQRKQSEQKNSEITGE